MKMKNSTTVPNDEYKISTNKITIEDISWRMIVWYYKKRNHRLPWIRYKTWVLGPQFFTTRVRQRASKIGTSSKFAVSVCPVGREEKSSGIATGTKGTHMIDATISKNFYLRAELHFVLMKIIFTTWWPPDRCGQWSTFAFRSFYLIVCTGSLLQRLA